VRNIVRVDGKPISGGAATSKTEARQLTIQALRDLKSGRVEVSQKSFTTYAREWLTRYPKHSGKPLSPSTAAVYGYWIDAIEQTALGQTPIAAITDRMLKAWKGELKLANSTLRNRCRFVNQILTHAGSEARVEVPPKREHERRPYRPSELQTLRDRLAEADPHLRMLVLLCWQGGLRRSEALGLRHEDREGEGVLLRRVVVLGKSKIHVKQIGKTSKSLGWIPLPTALLAEIGPPRAGYVVGGQDKPLNPRVIYEDLRRLLAGTPLAGVKHLAFHSLRRTFGRTLLESGADVVTAAKMMRHDPQMLLNEYAKTREDLMLEAMKKAFGKGESTT
jgi:integrase